MIGTLMASNIEDGGKYYHIQLYNLLVYDYLIFEFDKHIIIYLIEFKFLTCSGIAYLHWQLDI